MSRLSIEEAKKNFFKLMKKIAANYIGTSPISVETVIDFLKSPSGKSFVYSEKGESPRPKKIVFQSRFEEWFLNKTAYTREDYKKKAKGQNKGENVEQIKPYPFPTFHHPKNGIFEILRDTLSAKLVRAEKPQIIPTRDVPKTIGKLKSLKKLSKRNILIKSEKIRQQQLAELKKRNPNYTEAKETPEAAGESDFWFPPPPDSRTSQTIRSILESRQSQTKRSR